ncbi:type II toxin-antitoxin system VapC family toxin [Candidatus Woesearchaeota archaeon]|nr:type II toxin-antitoxin system VapC family toxin [Candidatus Woesearchaeota archaeon]
MTEYANNIYLDTNIFIYASASSDVIGEQCIRILTALAKGKITAVTSLITFDELFYKLNKLKGFEAAILFAENFLAMPNLVLAEVNGGIVTTSLATIKQYKLAPRDAIHVATALTHKAAAIVSDDRDFSKVAELNYLGIADFIKQLESH